MGSEQKVAVITGASQGIGAGLVKGYRDRNYRVIATSRSIKQGNELGCSRNRWRYRRSENGRAGN